MLLAEPLRDCTDALLKTLDEDMRRKKPVKSSQPRPVVEIDESEDFDIICQMRKQKNGEKFKKLYDDGDTGDYKSQSEADAALCTLLAYRVGPNPKVIDRLFRKSALYREKWEREDYSSTTIEYGIRAREAPYFIKFNPKNGKPSVSVPLLARYVRENLTYILVRDNGKQGMLKYVYEKGCYRLYSSDMFMGVIKKFIEDYDEELVKSQVNEVLQHINTDLNYKSQDALNSNESIINFNNGILCVTANGLKIREHNPEILSTIQIPCKWTGMKSPTPNFDRYMETLCDGDEDVKELLMEFIGACISNVKGWRMKKSLFLVGDGSTGKSQLKSLVERLLGRGNFIGIDLKEIEARFGTGAVYGTRLAGSSDMSFMTVDELKTFKKMTGGDSLYAEFKGQQAFEFTYNGLLWFCMNKLPRFGGDDGQWVYDRIMVVNCPNVIPAEKQDRYLLEKMYEERESIVFKAVKALQRVIRNGYSFTEPQSVIDARTEYRSSNSTVICFFNECMCPWPEKGINSHCTTGRVYKVYRAWCLINNNGYAKSARDFRDDIANYLGGSYADITTRRKGNTYYRDYTLTEDIKHQYAKDYGYEEEEFLVPD